MEQEQGKGKGKGRGKAKPKLALVPNMPGNVVPIAKGQGKAEAGLTSKQRAFADKVAEGATLADSYRAAYDAGNMQPASIYTEACKLMANPLIAQRVNEKSREILQGKSHDAARIRLSVIERLQIEANDTNNPASVRVRALELLGKITDVALFTERLQTDTATTRSADQITEELKERIAKLAG
jgi:phage terminase small subunit